MAFSSLQHPRARALFVAFAIACGLWLRWPAVEAGPGSDDYMQYAMLQGAYPTPRSQLDLFNFADGTDADNRPLMDYGTLPWWTAPGLRLAMLRPLSSVLVQLDVRLVELHPALPHLHTLLWWTVLVVLVALLLFRTVPAPVAALAVLAFVFEEGHGMPVVWLANRGALVSLVFGLLGLMAHMRYRAGAGLPALALSALSYALGLLAGEWVFPALSYLFAYEALEMRDSLRRRALALAPVAVLALALLLVRSAMHYGARQSGVYIDPGAEPLHFLRAAGHRIPVFFADLVYGIPAVRFSFGTPWRDALLSLDLIPPPLWARLPDWRFWHVLLGVSAMAVLGWVLWRSQRQGAAAAAAPAPRPGTLPERVPGFWLLGSLLALVPVLGSFPSSRLVMPASIGVFAGLAALCMRWWRNLRAAFHARRLAALWPLLGLGLMAHLHLWSAGHSSRGEVAFSAGQYAAVRDWVREAELDDRRLSGQRLILLSTTEHTLGFFLPFVLHHLGRPMPRSAWLLSGAMLPHDLHRPSERVLELQSLGGGMGVNAMEQLYRDARLPFRVGERVRLDGLEVEVLQVFAGAATRVRFTFARPLEDPGYVFLEASREGLTRLPLPPVGGRLRVARSTFPMPGRMAQLLATRDPNVTCPGARPLVDDCVLGHAFADCGGRGAPVLACHGLGDCRWFAGGCVATGYLASACDADTPCCQDGWPYLDIDVFDHGPGAGKLASLLQGWGPRPWDSHTSMALDVQVAPGLPGQRPALSCGGTLGADGPGPCDGDRLRFLGAYAHSLAFAFYPPLGSAGWALAVDVVDDPAVGPRARACRVWQPSAFERSCDAGRPPDCAVAGALRLSALPAHGAELRTLAGELRARFADGSEIKAAF